MAGRECFDKVIYLDKNYFIEKEIWKDEFDFTGGV